MTEGGVNRRVLLGPYVVNLTQELVDNLTLSLHIYELNYTLKQIQLKKLCM